MSWLSVLTMLGICEPSERFMSHGKTIAVEFGGFSINLIFSLCLLSSLNYCVILIRYLVLG